MNIPIRTGMTLCSLSIVHGLTMLLLSQARVAASLTVPSLPDPTRTGNGSDRFFQDGREQFEQQLQRLLQNQQDTELDDSLLLLHPAAMEQLDVNECTSIRLDACVSKDQEFAPSGAAVLPE